MAWLLTNSTHYATPSKVLYVLRASLLPFTLKMAFLCSILPLRYELAESCLSHSCSTREQSLSLSRARTHTHIRAHAYTSTWMQPVFHTHSLSDTHILPTHKHAALTKSNLAIIYSLLSEATSYALLCCVCIFCAATLCACATLFLSSLSLSSLFLFWSPGLVAILIIIILPPLLMLPFLYVVPFSIVVSYALYFSKTSYSQTRQSCLLYVATIIFCQFLLSFFCVILSHLFSSYSHRAKRELPLTQTFVGYFVNRK